jgi:hypothetical protein
MFSCGFWIIDNVESGRILNAGMSDGNNIFYDSEQCELEREFTADHVDILCWIRISAF